MSIILYGNGAQKFIEKPSCKSQVITKAASGWKEGGNLLRAFKTIAFKEP
jgi:hypothetical protein